MRSALLPTNRGLALPGSFGRRPMAAGTAAKLSVTSTLSATLFAICAPLPSAIASRDPFMAGTSLTPSPIIAT